MECKHVARLSTEYCEGGLAAAVEQELSCHLRDCPRCQALIEYVQRESEALRSTADLPELDPDFRQRLMLQVGALGTLPNPAVIAGSASLRLAPRFADRRWLTGAAGLLVLLLVFGPWLAGATGIFPQRPQQVGGLIGLDSGVSVPVGSNPETLVLPAESLPPAPPVPDQPISSPAPVPSPAPAPVKKIDASGPVQASVPAERQIAQRPPTAAVPELAAAAESAPKSEATIAAKNNPAEMTIAEVLREDPLPILRQAAAPAATRPMLATLPGPEQMPVFRPEHLPAGYQLAGANSDSQDVLTIVYEDQPGNSLVLRVSNNQSGMSIVGAGGGAGGGERTSRTVSRLVQVNEIIYRLEVSGPLSTLELSRVADSVRPVL